MNCKREVPPNGGEFFMEVFICGNCKKIAVRLYERAQKDVKHLLVMMKEAIRLGLVQGQLQFRDPEQVEEVTRPDLLSRLAELAEQARENQARPKDEVCSNEEKTTQESTMSMKPHVATLQRMGKSATGLSSSSKPSPADSKSETSSSETPATPSSDSAGNANDTAH